MAACFVQEPASEALPDSKSASAKVLGAMQTAGTLAAGLQGPATSGCSQGQQVAAGEPVGVVDSTQQGPQPRAAGIRNGTDGAAMSSRQADTAFSGPQTTRQKGGRLARLGCTASSGWSSPERILPAEGQPAGLAPSHAELSRAARAVHAAASSQEVHLEAGQAKQEGQAEEAAQAEEVAAEGCAPSGSSPAAAGELQSPAAAKAPLEQPLPGKQRHSSGSERHRSDCDAQKQVGAVLSFLDRCQENGVCC